MSGHAGRPIEVLSSSGDRWLVLASDGVHSNRRKLARQTAYRAVAPIPVGVISRTEYQHQIIPLHHSVQHTWQDLRMELRSSRERLIGQSADSQQHRQRRSRVSVIPIASPFSEIASFTILTVTAVIRASCTNSVSQM